MKKLLIAAGLFMLVASQAQAAEVRATFGAKEDNTAYAVEYKNDGVVYYRPEGGVKWGYEKKTTSDTLTAQETGKTFVVAPTTTSTFTLPDADVGMEFTFIASDGNTGDTKQIILDPQSTDTFRGVVNSGSATTFVAGDSTTSPGDTGDSLTIFCAEDTYWDVKNRQGTWTDSN